MLPEDVLAAAILSASPLNCPAGPKKPIETRLDARRESVSAVGPLAAAAMA